MINFFTKNFLKKKLSEKQPLPTGVKEFHAWADRIIAGAQMVADKDSQKFALANDLMHLPPTVAFEADVYFIHKLRKYAVNQVADAVRNEIRDAAKARLAAEEESKKSLQSQTEATVTNQGDNVVQIQGV